MTADRHDYDLGTYRRPRRRNAWGNVLVGVLLAAACVLCAAAYAAAVTPIPHP
jgi:hypothetical protein